MKKLYVPKDDVTILDMYKKKMKISEIAKALKRSRASVIYRIRPLKTKKKRPKEEEQIVESKKETPIIEVIEKELVSEEVEVVTEDIPEEEVEIKMLDDEDRQYLYKEIPLPPAELDRLAGATVLTDAEIEALEEAAEYFNELQNRLIARIFEIIEEHMTEHQKKIIALMLKNKTYNNMALLLNINYTAVAHAIKGIKTRKHDKYHGGLERKLQKICTKDPECLEILKEISLIRQGNMEKKLKDEELEDEEVFQDSY